MTYSGRAIRRSDVLPVRLATAASSRTGARQLWRWWMALALLLLACDAALGSAAFGTGHSPAVSAGPATSAYSYEVEHCEADCSYDPVQHVAIPRASATAVGGSAAARQAGGHQVPTNGLAGFASPGFAAEGEGGGLLAGLKGRYRAVRMGGGDAGSISLGGAEFSDDEIAQLTYQHIGAGDIAGRPALDEISAALAKGERVPLEGQNAFKYEYGGVRVIVNGDAPWRSTAYYPGR